jgi:hypothetical protein
MVFSAQAQIARWRHRHAEAAASRQRGSSATLRRRCALFSPARKRPRPPPLARRDERMPPWPVRKPSTTAMQHPIRHGHVPPPGMPCTASGWNVRDATRSAGCEGHTDTDPWLPHISIAYSNATIPAAPIIAALGRRLPQTEITIRSISLMSQTQIGRSWQWRPVAEMHLTGELAAPR